MDDQLRRAAEIIRAGGVVAFPTETVYGLGANALDPAAAATIYELKGRPASSPLIVHVASVEMARELAAEWPAVAEQLASRFWPGPLSIVVKKQPRVPDIVTAGLPTVGLRMPAHTLALELIRKAGVPIAAPSANRFGELSPVRAEHVRAAFGDVLLVLDGGQTDVGIESTVVSVAESPPVLLRPGMISRDELEAVIGPLSMAGDQKGSHASPGLHKRHYQPRTRVILGPPPAEGTGVFLCRATRPAGVRVISMPADAAAYATRLYDTLHALDQEGLDWIAIEALPDSVEWDAIRDRISRASAR
jgi:L-threonylcarbamoyladenylate synthase